MDSLRYDLKVFLEYPAEVPLEAFIPLFHGWIQEQRLAELLIDVADYRHVPQGPGVVLVAHDAHYALDQTDGRAGLLYSRRRETHASRQGIHSLAERLASIWQCALTACHHIETDPTLPGLWRFRGNEMLLRVNDRLLAPPPPESYNTLCRSLEPLLATLYPDSQATIEPIPEDTSRLTVRITATTNPEVATLLARLETRALNATTVELQL
jgi:hypothetical protein